MRRLLDCPFQAELGAKDVRVAGERAGRTRPRPRAGLCPQRGRARVPADRGAEMFRALPARCGNTRAARVLDRWSPASAGGSTGTKEKSR